MLLFHWRNRVRSDQVHLTTLLFCTVKSTIHSWDIPPLPNAQMLPPDVADEVNCSCDIQRLSRGTNVGQTGVNETLEWSQTSSEGKNAEDGFCGNHFLFTYTVAFIHEPYNIFMCPLKAGGQALHPTTLMVPPTHKAAQAGRLANRWGVCFLLLGRDLCSFAGYSILHSFQLLQQLLAAR